MVWRNSAANAEGTEGGGGGGQGHETGDFSPLTVEGVGVHPREFFF